MERVKELKDIIIMSSTRSGVYYAIPTTLVVNGYFRDTYKHNGKHPEVWECRDYTFGNGLFEDELDEALRNKFDILLDADFTFDEYGIHDFIGEEELSDELKKKINRYIKYFHTRKHHNVEATYVNYFNGTIWQSIILTVDGQPNMHPTHCQVSEYLSKKIFNDFQNAILIKETMDGATLYDGNEYRYRVSDSSGNPFYFVAAPKF